MPLAVRSLLDAQHVGLAADLRLDRVEPGEPRRARRAARPGTFGRGGAAVCRRAAARERAPRAVPGDRRASPTRWPPARRRGVRRRGCASSAWSIARSAACCGATTRAARELHGRGRARRHDRFEGRFARANMRAEATSASAWAYASAAAGSVAASIGDLRRRRREPAAPGGRRGGERHRRRRGTPGTTRARLRARARRRPPRRSPPPAGSRRRVSGPVATSRSARA